MDQVLEGMAVELRDALVAHGKDPKEPGFSVSPPAQRAYDEYIGRGGTGYDDKEQLVRALIQRVTEL